MYIIFKAANDTLLGKVRTLSEERFGSLERILARQSSSAQLTVEVEEEARQTKGNTLLFRVSGNLTVDGCKDRYHASATDTQIETALNHMRDDLVREIRKSRGRTIRFLRKGGSTLKSLLRFGR